LADHFSDFYFSMLVKYVTSGSQSTPVLLLRDS